MSTGADLVAAARWLADAPPASGGLPDASGLADLARFAYALAAVTTRSDVATTCHRGCTACCHQRVLVTPAEAALLADVLRRPVVRQRVRRLARGAARSIDPSRGWLEARVPCPVLGPGGECEAYVDRPLACREHLATSDPRLCWDPDGGGIRLSVPDLRLSEVLAQSCTSLRGGNDERIPIDAALSWGRKNFRLVRSRWARGDLLRVFTDALIRTS